MTHRSIRLVGLLLTSALFSSAAFAADDAKRALRADLVALPAQFKAEHEKRLALFEGSTADMVKAHTELSAKLKPIAIRLMAASDSISPDAAATLIDRDLQALSRNLHHQMNYAGPGGSFEAVSAASIHLVYLQYAIAYHARKVFPDDPEFNLEEWTSSWSGACGFEEGC
ncbi:MAG: hypothetical protein OHK005_14930 [Candidatus Methylacidiphilales bacterium]